MTTLYHDDSFREVEELIRAAGRYVQPSLDLRPQTLEAARAQCRERLLLRGLQHAAAVVVLLGMFTLHAQRDEAARPPQTDSGQAVSLVRFSPGADEREAPWQMVDSLTDLRRRQAQLLRFDL